MPTALGFKKPAAGEAPSPIFSEKKQRNLITELSRRIRRRLSLELTSLEKSGQTWPTLQVLPESLRRADLESQWNSVIADPLVRFSVPLGAKKRREEEKEPLPARLTPVLGQVPKFRSLVSTLPGRSTAVKELVASDHAQALEPSPREVPSLSVDSASPIFRKEELEQDRPEPTLQQLLQQAHFRDGERLFASSDELKFSTVKKKSVSTDVIGPDPGSVPSQPSFRSPGCGNEPDDLYDLAEEIGRILADEARRHGIDV